MSEPAASRRLRIVWAHVLAVALFAVPFGVTAVGSAPLAAAHAALIGSAPADGAVVDEQPDRVRATFNEDMQAQFAAMTVIGPDGRRYDAGEPEVAGAVITVGVGPGGPAGTYTVNYRATSADGHVVSGSWSYRLTGSATAATPAVSPTSTPADTPAPAADDGTGTTLWPFALAITAIIAVGAIAATRRRS